MARINIDMIFFSDKRIARLSALTGDDRQKTNGRLLDVWHYCYENKRAELTEEEINFESEWVKEGSFADHLVDSKLAEKVNDSYIIKGVEDRIKYLLDCAERGRIGGLASAEARRSKPLANAKQTVKGSSSSLNPPPPLPPPPIKNIYIFEKELLDFWNEKTSEIKKIPKARHTESNYKKIKKALKSKPGYSNEDTKQAIVNYCEALDGWFSYYWPLWTFLRREKNTQFFPDEYVKENFTSKETEQAKDKEFNNALDNFFNGIQ